MHQGTFGAALAGLLMTSVMPAAGLELGGSAGLEARGYFESPQFPDQDGTDFQPSVFAAPELRWDLAGTTQRITLTPYVLLDARDGRRTHGDLREANWLIVGQGWDALVGVAQVFWGVTESRHLVNIVNQVDGVVDVDEEDYLGQPLANLNLTHGAQRLGVYLMTGFRERTFPGAHARLRGPLPIDQDAADLRANADHGNLDGALRYTVNTGDLDLGLAHFSGLGREPRLVPRFDGTRFELEPVYEHIEQTSVDAQLTLGAWALKLESLTRSGQGKRFEAAVAGFEYSLYQVFGSQGDVGLLAEYLYDNRTTRAPATPFEDDLFLGVRWSGNDMRDTHVLAGVVRDWDDGALAWSIEARRRFSDHLTWALDLRRFQDVDDGDVLAAIRRDDFAQLRVEYWF